MRHLSLRASVLTAAACVFVVGCSSSNVVDGAPTAAPIEQIDAAPGEIDTGAWSTTIRDLPEVAGDESLGRWIHAQRLAEFVTLPTEIDDTLTASKMPTGALTASSQLWLLLAGDQEAIAERNGFLGAWTSARGNNNPDAERSLVQAVMRFDTPEGASAAANEFTADAMRATDINPTPMVALNMPSMPTSLVTGAAPETATTTVQAQAFTARGPWLLHTWASASMSDRQWVTDSLSTALDLQEPLIDRMPVTPRNEFPALEIDIDRYLRLTVGNQADEDIHPADAATRSGVYGLRGAANFLSDPIGDMQVMQDTGTEHLAIRETSLYPAADEAGAAELFDHWWAAESDEYVAEEVAGPPGVPNVRCQKITTTQGVSHYCILRHGRYVATGSRADLTDAHQLISSQYVRLEEAG